MPNISQPQRQDEPAVTDADLASLLAGTTDAVPGLRPVADVLAALTAEATGMELAGEARALAEFRRRAGAPVPAKRARRSTAGLTSRLWVKVGASVAAVVVVLGGGVAAAFAGVLPTSFQRLAHEVIGAPMPPAPHDLPHRGRSAAHGQVVHGQPAVHGKPAASGGHGAKRQVRPHATPAPTAQGNPHAQGGQGNPHGQQGQGSGQGHQGSGQGQGNRHKQGNGQGQQSAGPHGPGQQGNPQNKGPNGSQQANRRAAGHPGRSVGTRPARDP
jgi:hypothetical protein